MLFEEATLQQPELLNTSIKIKVEPYQEVNSNLPFNKWDSTDKIEQIH